MVAPFFFNNTVLFPFTIFVHVIFIPYSVLLIVTEFFLMFKVSMKLLHLMTHSPPVLYLHHKLFNCSHYCFAEGHINLLYPRQH